eukprot:CAMPEP_0181293658 /NCGR_PEP_ID=MMETSP1101-20121128/3180_1 /TAXON_ID=46948 /ORGANISM="Rhodomonas abbreviata, Strain Caron Lab Isolate" /LENGTH=350 /DNA_ID=CAMNT_0023398255 /DNA_START=464 /DNA_END=1513 /DNA_ORIENTATION=+
MEEAPKTDAASALITAEAKAAEVEHFEQVIKAFQFYQEHGLQVVRKGELSYSRLPLGHQQILQHLPGKADAQKRAIEVNQNFLATIVGHAKSFICTSQLLHDARTHFDVLGSGETLDMDKIRCTLRQFMRDWSEEGANERSQCYQPITDALEAYYSHYPKEERYRLKVLLPGAGLGRLAYNVAKLGFSAQGCEFSYQMLISSNYILNYAPGPKTLALHPWVLSSSNVWDTEGHQLQRVLVPDELPGGLPPSVDFSMVAGDFLEVYRGQHGEWDCVATSFFIDTASNIVDYVEHIHSLLSDGGIWINLGPLLYHYTDSPDVDSIELSYSELRMLILHYGFEIQQEVERTCY